MKGGLNEVVAALFRHSGEKLGLAGNVNARFTEHPLQLGIERPVKTCSTCNEPSPDQATTCSTCAEPFRAAPDDDGPRPSAKPELVGVLMIVAGLGLGLFGLMGTGAGVLGVGALLYVGQAAAIWGNLEREKSHPHSIVLEFLAPSITTAIAVLVLTEFQPAPPPRSVTAPAPAAPTYPWAAPVQRLDVATLFGSSKATVRNRFGKPVDTEKDLDTYEWNGPRGTHMTASFEFSKDRLVKVYLVGLLASTSPNYLGMHADEVCAWLEVPSPGACGSATVVDGAGQLPAAHSFSLSGTDYVVRVTTIGSIEIATATFDEQARINSK